MADPLSAAHHELTLSPVQEQTTLEYRLQVASGGWLSTDAQGGPLTFSTPPGSGVDTCATLLADSQGGDFSEVFPFLVAEAADTQFILSLGDHVGLGRDPAATAESQYLDYFLGPFSAMTSHLPLFSVFGNHDAGNTSDAEIREVAVEAYTAYMVLPQGPLQSRPELVYSFDWGPLHIAVLDSVNHSLGRANGLLEQEQLDWLRQDMKQSTRRWRVVALHHMVEGWQAPRDQTQSEWFHIANWEEAHEVFRDVGVDLVLNAHRHAYNAYVRDGITYVTMPALSRDMLLGERYGPPEWSNLGGEQGTFEHAYGNVFGYGILCANTRAISVTLSAFDGKRAGIVGHEVPAVLIE